MAHRADECSSELFQPQPALPHFQFWHRAWKLDSAGGERRWPGFEYLLLHSRRPGSRCEPPLGPAAFCFRRVLVFGDLSLEYHQLARNRSDNLQRRYRCATVRTFSGDRISFLPHRRSEPWNDGTAGGSQRRGRCVHGRLGRYLAATRRHGLRRIASGNRGPSGSGDDHSVRSRDQSDRRIHLRRYFIYDRGRVIESQRPADHCHGIAFGDDGDQVGTTQLALAPHAKSANVLAAYAGMAGVFRKQGRVVVSVPNGAVSVLALRFGGAGFSNIPVNHR